jgi:hypothetical protein
MRRKVKGHEGFLSHGSSWISTDFLTAFHPRPRARPSFSNLSGKSRATTSTMTGTNWQLRQAATLVIAFVAKFLCNHHRIIRGLDNAKVMIVVLSASSNRSRPVIKEVERAFGKGIVIIPVRTEEVAPSEALEFFLSSEQWLDAITLPLEAHLDRLARTVEEYLVEQGWIGTENKTAASSIAPPATPERLSQDAGETRRILVRRSLAAQRRSIHSRIVLV